MIETDNNNTLVKEGYKQTKLGWIPEDWTTPTISEVFDFLKTTSFSRNQLNYDDENDIYYIHYGDIHATYKKPLLNFEFEINVPKLNNDVVLPNSIQYLNDGDVIIADASEDYEGVGEAIEIENLKGKTAISGLHTFALRDKNALTIKGFRTYIFKNPIVKKALKTIATGSKVYGISKSNTQKFKIVLPTLPEQQKIASILNTWDKAIAAQEKLIAQKQQLKKGLMRQLLTGKKRFSGFEGEWETSKLGELTTIKAGGTPSKAKQQYWGGNIRWMNSGELNLKKVSEVEGRINVIGLKNSSASLLPKHCVLIGLAGQGKTRGTAAINLVELCTNQSVAAILPSNNFDPFFMYYLIDSKYELLRQLSAGDGGRGGLNLGILNSIKVSIPNIKEQEIIVAILSNADDIINKENYKLSVLKKQKQGLMQQLLTGGKRVKA